MIRHNYERRHFFLLQSTSKRREKLPPLFAPATEAVARQQERLGGICTLTCVCHGRLRRQWCMIKVGIQGYTVCHNKLSPLSMRHTSSSVHAVCSFLSTAKKREASQDLQSLEVSVPRSQNRRSFTNCYFKGGEEDKFLLQRYHLEMTR